jgi:lysyl-tRNA synthetase class 2
MPIAHQRFRVKLVQTLRGFFQSKDFEEVLTPLRVPEVNTEPHIRYFQVAGNYLIASPELALKSYLFDALDADPKSRPSLYQCGPVFREGRDEEGPLHAQEFTMLEYYHPAETMAQELKFFQSLMDHLGHHSGVSERLEMAVISVPELFYQRTGLVLDMESDASLREALRKFNPHSASLRAKDSIDTWNDLFFEVYVSALEPWLGVQGLVALTHFPRNITSMARPSIQHSGTVERFEVLYKGIELCNGYMETFDPTLLRQQMERDRREMTQDRSLPEKWLKRIEKGYLRHHWTMPSYAGVAVGVERLALMLLKQVDPLSDTDIQQFLHR